MKELVAVTIPVYKTIVSGTELASLEQCLKILNKHPIIFFAPESLDLSFYENICAGKTGFHTERFADIYFAGIAGYNQLMLSDSFYRRFSHYQFILIYQLDAWVFRDELAKWCRAGYDYIGAPYLFVDLERSPIRILTKFRRLLKWMNKMRLTTYRYRHVGNGGFSLRNVGKTIMFLRIFRRVRDRWTLNEDSLFTHYGNLVYPIYRLAPEEEAMDFAFEDQPGRAYLANHARLPFGCHAFNKPKNISFWSEFISI